MLKEKKLDILGTSVKTTGTAVKEIVAPYCISSTDLCQSKTAVYALLLTTAF